MAYCLSIRAKFKLSVIMLLFQTDTFQHLAWPKDSDLAVVQVNCEILFKN